MNPGSGYQVTMWHSPAAAAAPSCWEQLWLYFSAPKWFKMADSTEKKSKPVMKIIYLAAPSFERERIDCVYKTWGLFLSYCLVNVSDTSPGGAGSLSACKTSQGEPKVTLITAVNPQRGNYKAMIKTKQSLKCHSLLQRNTGLTGNRTPDRPLNTPQE